jgi:hypothetical protein
MWTLIVVTIALAICLGVVYYGLKILESIGGPKGGN